MHAPPICFRDGGEIRVVARAEFTELVEQGKVTGDTVVFDGTLSSVGAFRDGKWEVAARDSWHARAWNLG